MDNSQALSTHSQQTLVYNFTTTGISKIELSCLNLSSNFIFSSSLTPKTNFLITYKAIFTEKYIQALIWNIPIVNIAFLYDTTANYKKYQMKPFQGAVFSTSGITDEIFANYLILYGAIYEPNSTIFIDFLICDNEDSEKYKFCVKYSIPIIKSSQVFTNNFHLFKKNIKYDAKQLQPKEMFFEKVFYLDNKLPTTLFNRLRRIIIENEGTRVSIINDDTKYIITLDFEQYKDSPYSSKLIYHQYLFDCVESKSLLYHEFYRYSYSVSKKIIKNTFSFIDKNLPKSSEYVNKLKALGSVVKSNLDARITHYITQNSDFSNLISFHKNFTGSVPKGKDFLNEDGFPFKIVTPEWVDQCLFSLKHLKEAKYSTSRPILNLKRRSIMKKEEKILFQFTGLPSFFKEKAISKFKEFGIEYIDSDKFENCTHLIMGSISSSEKFFCSLAKGCWILTPEFIENFNNDSNFDYYKYEWKPIEGMSDKDKRVAESISKWRKSVQIDQRKPFNRWNVKIYALDKKYQPLKNIIIAGGGKMDEKEKITHVFVDKSYSKEIKEIKEEKVLSADSIFAYLFK